MSAKYVVLYDSAENVLDEAPAHFPAHSERADEFTRGTLLMVGTFADPQEEGSMAIFTTARPPRSSSPGTRSS